MSHSNYRKQTNKKKDFEACTQKNTLPMKKR